MTDNISYIKKDKLYNKSQKKANHNKIIIIVSMLFWIYAITLIIPFLWGIMSSLKTGGEYFEGVLVPAIPKFNNYIKAFSELFVANNNLFVMSFNSLWYAIGNTLPPIIISTITAYACSKYKFALGKLCVFLSFAMMIIPIVNNLPAQFRLAKILHTYDSPFSIIASFGGLGFNLLLLYSFFNGIDKGYAEAAFIEGAGHMRVFLKIMLPQAFSPIIALSMSGLIGLWNDAQGPLVFLPSYPTLATGLYLYQIEAIRGLNYPVLLAGLFISSIPSVLLFIACNKHIMSLQFGGGIKT